MGVRGDVSFTTPQIFIEVWLKEGFLRGHIRLNKHFHIHTSSQDLKENLGWAFLSLGSLTTCLKFCFSVTCDTASLHWGLV